MTDREIRSVQEDRLYENIFALEMLNTGKTDHLKTYLIMMGEKAKNGMTSDEVDAVRERAKNAANEMK